MAGNQLPKKGSLESHNRIAFISDGTFFNLGSAFLEANTVLPTFMATLTKSSLLIGLVSTVRSLGYFLPQIFVAGHIKRLEKKKPFMMQAGLAMRMAALGMALSVLLAKSQPGVSLLLFFGFLLILSFTDGFGGLPWMDLVARTISPQRRASLFGTMQGTGGVAAFLGGFLVQALLAKGNTYPMNYFVVFLLGFIFLSGSLVSMSFIIEPEGTFPPENGSIMGYLKGLPKALGESQLFRRVMLVRAMTGTLYLALPFFALHAQRALGFPQSMVGVFVSCQMIGTVLGGPLWGHIGDNRGAFWVVRLVTLLSALTGFLSLLAGLVSSIGVFWLKYAVYFVLYVVLGAGFGGTWIGFSAYVLDISKEESRSTFLGLLNTLSGPLTLLSLLGGWVLERFGFFWLFAIQSILGMVAFFMAWRLPDSRRETAK